MTQSFVRLAILHEGERCAEGCPSFRMNDDEEVYCAAFLAPLCSADDDSYLRHAKCLAATTQQARDDAVLEAAEAYIGTQGPALRSTGNEARLAKAIDARRSATREGGT